MVPEEEVVEVTSVNARMTPGRTTAAMLGEANLVEEVEEEVVITTGVVVIMTVEVDGITTVVAVEGVVETEAAVASMLLVKEDATDEREVAEITTDGPNFYCQLTGV